jgi:putative transcriptional regulator
MSISCKLSTLMGEYRFTIQEVHERTGLSRNTISNLYNDRITRIDFDTAEKLCSLFSCTLNDLFRIKSDSSIITGGSNE